MSIFIKLFFSSIGRKAKEWPKRISLFADVASALLRVVVVLRVTSATCSVRCRGSAQHLSTGHDVARLRQVGCAEGLTVGILGEHLLEVLRVVALVLVAHRGLRLAERAVGDVRSALSLHAVRVVVLRRLSQRGVLHGLHHASAADHASGAWLLLGAR